MSSLNTGEYLSLFPSEKKRKVLKNFHFGEWFLGFRAVKHLEKGGKIGLEHIIGYKMWKNPLTFRICEKQ